MLLSAVAVAATGIAVSSGVLTEQDAVVADAHPALRAAPRLDEATAALAERERSTSRSARRTTIEKKVDKKNKADDRDRSSARRAARTKNPADGNPRDIARALLPKFGFSADQFGCLDALYVSESGWNPRADNPTSSAYGIPQALTEAHEAARGLHDQPHHPDQVGPGLHPRQLRHAVRRLVVQAGQRLVLTRRHG